MQTKPRFLRMWPEYGSLVSLVSFCLPAATLTGWISFSDGGGPGVISQLLIVDELMHQIQWALKLEEVPRPCDYTEMMVGSGLGAYVVDLLH
jgi:hypothetical protein